MSLLDILSPHVAQALLVAAWLAGLVTAVSARDPFKRVLGAAAAGLSALAALGHLGGVTDLRLAAALAVLAALTLLALAVLMRLRESYGDGDLADLAAAVDADEDASR